ncbi:unnamed protein product [Lymnaea stagnalis]|uniref:AIG1-type G domain-containing protein n=1 Tax=Lymnaea stagnalis TaxID=6523 RepID=A0AAV2HHF2_LYMST
MEKNIMATIFFILVAASHVLMSDKNKDIDLVIIGKTGNGKSATGNTILGKKSFVTSPNSKSVTKTAQFDYSEYNNRIIKVVDSPGIFDTDLSKEDGLKLFIDAIHNAIALNPEGYHAFLLVVRFGSRFTEEDQKTVYFLKKIFGEDFFSKFVIMVVTYGDNYDAEETGVARFSDWVKTQGGSLKNLVDECGGRVILFDNKCKDEVKKKTQVDQLLTMVDRLSVLGLRYTNSHFKMALDEREKMMVENILPMIREESLREASLILEQLGQVQAHEPKKRLDILEALESRAGALLEGIIEQDKGTGALDALIENAQHIVQNVGDQMHAANEALELQANKVKTKKKIKDLKETRDHARKDNNFQLAADLKEKIDYLERAFADQDETDRLRSQDLKVAYERALGEFKSAKEESAWAMIKSFGRGLLNNLYYILSFGFLRDL